MSDLKARREARMRKILENSTSRLKKITNLTESEENIIEPPGTNSNGFNNFNNTNAIPELIDEPISNDVSEIFHHNTVPETSQSLVDDELVSPYSKFNNNLREKVLIMLALLVRCVLLVTEYTETFHFLRDYRLNNILVPYFLFEIFDYTFFKPFLRPFSFEYLIEMFNFGVRREYVDKLLLIAKVLTHVIRDLAIYLFVFVCADQFLVYVKEIGA